MIDNTQVGSPGWWLNTLIIALNDKQQRLELLAKYIDGDAPLPEGAHGLREAYQQFQMKARTNFAELVVEAVAERMRPSGFRVGDEAGLDKDALKIWSANELDAAACDVHSDMLAFADGYVIVGPPEKDASRPKWYSITGSKRGAIPVITREDPKYVITAYDPLIPSKTVAGLKMYTDTVTDKDYAYLYLPGVIYVASRQNSSDVMTMEIGGFEWEPKRAPERLPSKFKDIVPIVRFHNRRGFGEYETHLDLLDRINYMILQRLVIAALQAYRQRAIKGSNSLPDVQLDANGEPLLDSDDNPIPVDYQALFAPGPGSLWLLPDGAEPWESQNTDLSPILSAVKDDVRDLAAVTRTPMSMLLPEGQNQSAEGASFAREGLIFKTNDRITRATYGWNQVMTLALLFYGGKDVSDIETLWLPPERLTLSERSDATSKLTAAGVPWKTIMTDIMQFPPEKVEEMEQERLTDAFVTGLGATTDVA